jgi:dUTP pyrophosphatase
MNIKVISKSKNPVSSCSTPFSAGWDLQADIGKDIVPRSMERAIGKTSLFLRIPDRYESEIWPGSGLTICKGKTFLNSLGTIYADYRGEVCSIPANLLNQNFVIKDGERIFQMFIVKHQKTEWINEENLINIKRGALGLRHTGKA